MNTVSSGRSGIPDRDTLVLAALGGGSVVLVVSHYSLTADGSAGLLPGPWAIPTIVILATTFAILMARRYSHEMRDRICAAVGAEIQNARRQLANEIGAARREFAAELRAVRDEMGNAVERQDHRDGRLYYQARRGASRLDSIEARLSAIDATREIPRGQIYQAGGYAAGIVAGIEARAEVDEEEADVIAFDRGRVNRP